MTTTNPRLPGILSVRSSRRTLAATATAFFQPRTYPFSLPYQVEAIPVSGGDAPVDPQEPGSIYGVPPQESGSTAPSFNQLSLYLTQPRSMVYVGEALDPTIVPTGSATAPFPEIADAFAWAAAQVDTRFEFVVAPGIYVEATVPNEKSFILSGSSYICAGIAIEGTGVLLFVGVQSFQGAAPPINFPVYDAANAVYFDSCSAQAFGMSGGTIANGVPFCGGPGPYLAMADSAFAEFASAIQTGQYRISIANGTPDEDTIGVVYPGVSDVTASTVALVWPSGTVIPAATGLAAGPLYRDTNGTITATLTTQQVGVDDTARVYVGLHSMPPSSAAAGVVLGGHEAMLSVFYLGLGGQTANMPTGVPGDVRGTSRSLSSLTFGVSTVNISAGAITAQLYASSDEGATFGAITGATASIPIGGRTATVSFPASVIPALGRVVARIDQRSFSYSVSIAAD